MSAVPPAGALTSDSASTSTSSDLSLFDFLVDDVIRLIYLELDIVGRYCLSLASKSLYNAARSVPHPLDEFLSGEGFAAKCAAQGYLGILNWLFGIKLLHRMKRYEFFRSLAKFGSVELFRMFLVDPEKAQSRFPSLPKSLTDPNIEQKSYHVVQYVAGISSSEFSILASVAAEHCRESFLDYIVAEFGYFFDPAGATLLTACIKGGNMKIIKSYVGKAWRAYDHASEFFFSSDVNDAIVYLSVAKALPVIDFCAEILQSLSSPFTNQANDDTKRLASILFDLSCKKNPALSMALFEKWKGSAQWLTTSSFRSVLFNAHLEGFEIHIKHKPELLDPNSNRNYLSFLMVDGRHAPQDEANETTIAMRLHQAGFKFENIIRREIYHELLGLGGLFQLTARHLPIQTRDLCRLLHVQEYIRVPWTVDIIKPVWSPPPIDQIIQAISKSDDSVLDLFSFSRGQHETQHYYTARVFIQFDNVTLREYVSKNDCQVIAKASSFLRHGAVVNESVFIHMIRACFPRMTTRYQFWVRKEIIRFISDKAPPGIISSSKSLCWELIKNPNPILCGWMISKKVQFTEKLMMKLERFSRRHRQSAAYQLVLALIRAYERSNVLDVKSQS